QAENLKSKRVTDQGRQIPEPTSRAPAPRTDQRQEPLVPGRGGPIHERALKPARGPVSRYFEHGVASCRVGVWLGPCDCGLGLGPGLDPWSWALGFGIL